MLDNRTKPLTDSKTRVVGTIKCTNDTDAANEIKVKHVAIAELMEVNNI